MDLFFEKTLFPFSKNGATTPYSALRALRCTSSTTDCNNSGGLQASRFHPLSSGFGRCLVPYCSRSSILQSGYGRGAAARPRPRRRHTEGCRAKTNRRVLRTPQKFDSVRRRMHGAVIISARAARGGGGHVWCRSAAGHARPRARRNRNNRPSWRYLRRRTWPPHAPALAAALGMTPEPTAADALCWAL
ncbi:hypothetical protein EVAR_75227_1 [Eumeta japonica]|uniref:Uncharacterized protein n=1 Tax=Eumeta variegata TaxID=151549 RepID=A0A4C1VBP2_EUMVA|nr:hypothetical protein EVAR_75227_1 [Eumeta japonica]